MTTPPSGEWAGASRYEIVGGWWLASWTATTSRATVAYPLGERAEGSLVYTPDGRVSVMLAARDRAALDTDDILGGSERDRAAAYSSFMAYSGRYEIDGNVIVHRIEMSLFPNWVGTEQRRHFAVVSGELKLHSQPFDMGGEHVVHELRWARYP